MLLKNKYPSSSRGAAIPQRPALAVLQNTIEFQRSTVEHIPLMHQFQCTKCLNTCKLPWHSINKEDKKSPGTSWNPQFHCAHIEHDSTLQRRPPHSSRMRANFSPQWNLCLPKKHNVSCKYKHSNRILDVAVPMQSANNDPQNTIQLQHITQEHIPFEKPCHSRSTAISTD